MARWWFPKQWDEVAVIVDERWTDAKVGICNLAAKGEGCGAL